MFHENDYLILGDGLFRETNSIFQGLYHSSPKNEMRRIFCV